MNFGCKVKNEGGVKALLISTLPKNALYIFIFALSFVKLSQQFHSYSGTRFP